MVRCGKVVDVSSKEVPEPWATRITARGFTRRDGGPNVSALARAIGVSVETARRAVKGIGTPDPQTVAALAEALGGDVQLWAGQNVTAGPYAPPQESALLTGPQRDALTDLIRAIAAGQRQKVGGEHVERSAPIGELVTEDAPPAITRDEAASRGRPRAHGQ